MAICPPTGHHGHVPLGRRLPGLGHIGVQAQRDAIACADGEVIETCHRVLFVCNKELDLRIVAADGEAFRIVECPLVERSPVDGEAKRCAGEISITPECPSIGMADSLAFQRVLGEVVLALNKKGSHLSVTIRKSGMRISSDDFSSSRQLPL